MWNAETGDKMAELTGHAGAVNSVGWSRDGSKIFSCSSDNSIIVWNAEIGIGMWEKGGGKFLELTGHLGPVNSIAWNGSKLISGSADKTVMIWLTDNDVQSESGARLHEAHRKLAGGSSGSQGKVIQKLEPCFPCFVHCSLTMLIPQVSCCSGCKIT